MAQAQPAYRLKIERAKSHINDLTAQIHAFNARTPYAITAENDDQARERVWKLKVNECVPPIWSTIIGDAIHNIRASLDVLLCTVVRHCDPDRQSINHVHFIIRDTKKEFETALPNNIRGASDEAIKIVHELKPYKDGNEALWRLHKLDILDKHQAIIPVGSAYNGVDIAPILNAGMAELLAKSGMPSHPPLDPIFLTPADRMFPLRDGVELFRATLNTPLPRDDEIKFTTDVSFGEGQIIDGESVVPALLHLVGVVEGIFDVFEARILN